MKKYLSIILFSLLAYCLPTKPYVYGVDVWSNGDQDVYCFNDFHGDLDYASVQKQHFLEAAEKHNAAVIVEDMSEYTGTDPVIKQWIAGGVNNHKQFLLYLTSECDKNGVEAYSVEFRQESTIGTSGGNIHAEQVFRVADTIDKEVRSYNDKKFNSFYQAHLKMFDAHIGNPCKEWLAPIRDSKVPIKQACASLPFPHTAQEAIDASELNQFSKDQQKEWLIKLYNGYLVEPRIVHTLAHTKNKTVFICAGAAHIYRMRPALEQAGYQQVRSVKGDITSPSPESMPAIVNIEKVFAHTVQYNQKIINEPIAQTEQNEHVNQYWVLFGLLGIVGLIALTILNRKLKRFAQLCIAFGLLSAMTGADAYVFKLDLWSNGTQKLYCLSDGHYPTSLSPAQTNEFIEQVKKEKGAVIIEDILGYEGKNSAVQDALANFIEPDQHFLPALTHACTSKSIDARNIEFRQPSFASRQGFGVSGKQVYENTDRVKQQASHYHDGPVFNACYEKYLREIDQIQTECKPYIDQVRTQQECLKTAIPKTDYPEQLNATISKFHGVPPDITTRKKHILKFYDAALIDMRILHEMAQLKHKNALFVCAGGWHIENLEDSFERLGYKKLETIEGTQLIKSNFPGAVALQDAFKTLEKHTTVPKTQTDSKGMQYGWFLLLLALIPFGALLIRKLRIILPVLTLWAFASCGMTQSYIERFDLWENKEGKLIYCLHDEHFPAYQTEKQRSDLLKAAKDRKAAVIVEDMKTYDGDNVEVQRSTQTYTDWPHNFLLNLTNICKDHEICVDNVEFRQASNASLSGYAVTSKDTFDLSDRIKQEISTYDDGPEFNQCYKTYLSDLDKHQRACKSFFKQIRDKDERLYHLLPKTKYYKQLDKVLSDSFEYVAPNKQARKNDLITMWDAPLIDLLILHKMAEHKHNPHIIICAGGWHLENLEDAFKMLGYKQLSSTDGSIPVKAKEASQLPAAVNLKDVFDQAPKLPMQSHDTTQAQFVLLAIIGLIALLIISLQRRPMKRLLLLLCVFVSSVANAHIYRVEQWANEADHKIYTFEDFHTSRFPQNQKNKTQRSDIVEAARQRGATVITEDMYLDLDALMKNPAHYDAHSVKTLKGMNELSDKTTPLMALTPACNDAWVPVVNVEFRQPSLVSTGGYRVSVKSCLDATQRVASEVSRFDDGPILNSIYQAAVEKHEKIMKQGKPFFDQIREKKDKTVEDLFEKKEMDYTPCVDDVLRTMGWTERRIDNATADNKLESVFQYYDVSLVDAQILHAISQNKNKPLFVCAGFKHIENIEQVLKQLGYNKTQVEGKGLLEGNTMEPSALDIADAMKALDPNPVAPTSQPWGTSVLILVSLLLIVGYKEVRRRLRIAYS